MRSGWLSNWSVKLLFAVGFVIFPAPVTAQLKPEVQLGSRIPVKPEVVPAPNAGLIKKGFAKCVFTKNKLKALLVLNNSDPESIDYIGAGTTAQEIDDYLGMDLCLGRQANATQRSLGFTFSNKVLRSMLAEEAYLARFATPPRLLDGAVEVLQRTYTSAEPRRANAVAMGRFADCLTFNGLPDADAILRTTPGSAEERNTARALAPILGKCLTQGQTLGLNTTTIRAIAADGLWTRFARDPTKGAM